MQILSVPMQQSMSHILVCPDSNNKFNQLIPHIKLFDSFASGKPLVFSNFNCLKEIKEKMHGFEEFKPGNIKDLEQKMKIILDNYLEYQDQAKKNINAINQFSYRNASKMLIKEIRKNFDN